MNVTQLSVFMENKPGHLQNVLKTLADQNINIITLTIAETSDFGVLRMIVNDPEKAKKVLHDARITCSTTEVLAVELDDRPGSLFKAIDTFAKNNLNIEYMYAFTEKRGDKAVMIFRFDDIEAAKKAMAQEGYQLVKNIDIIGAGK
ncbi:MAG TPA: ACT domain-containing protein [Spirochaetota bacterium]|nr:ACT domain-containing protein [Spirochaetota bacterium]HPC40209.1 ACT domain-containing protein [Spirochaetota bacterium]HPL16189.1 ACT domain-containing protein [Spirochaetota bacterium]HQF07317.1 ACT domain-containing protein [Spirochaetota bacterium]HQH96218.1 ACT domain-containing protein [Spirochaetota bacterium]